MADILGNSDRHQSNWAILAETRRENKGKKAQLNIRRSPLYDNGSSLCCYINSAQIYKYFSSDPGPFRALVSTKSRSMIRIDGTCKALPTHEEVIKYLIKKYPATNHIGALFICNLSDEIIDAILDKYPVEILEKERNLLIRRFLKEKKAILRTLIRGREQYEK